MVWKKNGKKMYADHLLKWLDFDNSLLIFQNVT